MKLLLSIIVLSYFAEQSFGKFQLEPLYDEKLLTIQLSLRSCPCQLQF